MEYSSIPAGLEAMQTYIEAMGYFPEVPQLLRMHVRVSLTL